MFALFQFSGLKQYNCEFFLKLCVHISPHRSNLWWFKFSLSRNNCSKQGRSECSLLYRADRQTGGEAVDVRQEANEENQSWQRERNPEVTRCSHPADSVLSQAECC